MIPGVYYGYCWLKEITNDKIKNLENEKLPAIISFGFNPQYHQKNLNLEVFILHQMDGAQFYDTKMDLDINGYLRPE